MLPVKNREYTINIDALSSDGAGIGRIDGFAIFIKGAVPGDTILAKVVHLNKSYGFAEIVKILSPSDSRREPPCDHFKDCGGCQLMCLDYQAQCEYKRGLIKDALKRIGGIECEPNFCPAPQPLRYRNKMVFPFSPKGEWGFYKSGSHEVVPLNDCQLGDSLNIDILNCVQTFFRLENIPFYDEKTHTGVLRRVFTRASGSTGEIMVVISINADTIPHRERLVYNLRQISPRIGCIMLNINKKRTNLVLGENNILLYGSGRLTDTLTGLSYDISAHSFFQINHEQTERLYKTVLDYAALDNTQTVLDLYCGIGTISLAAAQLAKHVIGVEIVPAAIEDANKNAERNNIKNAEFYCAAAEDIVPKLIECETHPDVVILDPPRKGSDEKTLKAILSAQPQRIVYVSCNPATLARDVKYLCSDEYSLKRITGYDLFPQTVHVECVVLMSRTE